MRKAALLLLCLLLPPAAAGCGGGGASGRNGTGGDPGAELTLRGMEMTELRPAGVRYRLSAERATYSLAGRMVKAGVVTFGLREAAGDVRVTAPEARWDVRNQRAGFPRGCEAEYPGGWSARAPAADLDLRARVLSAPGPSSYSGPGFSMTGEALVWRWREGKAELRNPKAAVEPGGIQSWKRG
jgi:hypothetical protein